MAPKAAAPYSIPILPKPDIEPRITEPAVTDCPAVRGIAAIVAPITGKY